MHGINLLVILRICLILRKFIEKENMRREDEEKLAINKNEAREPKRYNEISPIGKVSHRQFQR